MKGKEKRRFSPNIFIFLTERKIRMKFKKITSAVLAAAMLIPSTCIVSYAEQDQAMKQALTYVKERITVPKELSHFNYNSRVVAGKTQYTFTWETVARNEQWQSLSVTIRGKVITSYYLDSWDDYSKDSYTFAKLAPEEIVEKAKEAVRTLNPTVCDYIEVDDTPRISLWGDEARVTIRRVKDGVPVRGATGVVSIDKDTGELKTYSLDWILGAGFADPSEAISKETAQKSFEKEFPLELVYTTEYDWENDKFIPHLIYRQTKYGEIDALTGKLSTFEDSYYSYDDGYVEEDTVDDDMDMDGANPSTGKGDNSITFTEDEIEKLEQENKLIKADEAIKLIQDMGVFNIPTENVESTYSRCDYNEMLNAYTRYVSFQSNVSGYVSIDGGDDPIEILDDVAEDVAEVSVYGSFTINAETGEVLSYSCWNGYTGDTKLTSEKKADKLLTSYFNKIAGNRASEFPLEKTVINYGYEDSKNTAKPKMYTVSADISRYVNDIRCDSESASITVDRNGKVADFGITYYEIEYPAPKNIISEEDAYKKYFEQVDYALRFRCALKDNKKVVTAMVYASDDRLNIDAFSGDLVNYDGSEYYREIKNGKYTDLEGSKYKKIAEKLAIYGITLMDEEGRLNADEIITRAEFGSLISAVGSYGSAGDKPDSALTRQFAAKMLTSRYLNENVAELPIFRTSYSDVKKDSKYAGYIAVADALGLMSGKNGKFNPSGKITRGQALQLIYNILAK